jgi:hypothetical protein
MSLAKQVQVLQQELKVCTRVIDELLQQNKELKDRLTELTHETPTPRHTTVG